MTKDTNKTKRREFLNLLEEKIIDMGTKILKSDTEKIKNNIDNTAKKVTSNVIKQSFIGAMIEKGKKAQTKAIYKMLLAIATLFIVIGGLQVLVSKIGYGDYFVLILGVLVLISALIFKLVNENK
jgi:23S rRNA pseudoU1915 N3-methylase RlmH